jgi:hypothetical protein
MVKQAEKKVKKNPLTPIFGIIIAVGLGFVCYVIADFLLGRNSPIAQLKALAFNPSVGTYKALIAGALWFVMIAALFFLSAVAAGKHPDDAIKRMPLPPRTTKKNKDKY